MKKRFVKKTEVLREGYEKGLKDAMRIINEMIENGEYTIDDLIVAIQEDSTSKVKEIIESGVDVNKRKGKWTALHYAAESGNAEIAKMLLEAGARTEVRGLEGLTPLHIAANNGHSSVVAYLLDWHASPTIMDEHGRTPIDLVKNRLRDDKIDYELENSLEIINHLFKINL